MTQMRVEIQGSADEVVRVLRQLGGSGLPSTVSDTGGSMETPAVSGDDATPATSTPGVAGPDEMAPGEWTESLAGEFLAGLDPVARQLVLYVWQAGASGIHRSALCQRTELTPGDLRSLLMRMGHALGRFQRERGLALPRPVAANSPLQSYFVDPEFAAAANSQMFGEMLPRQLAEGAGSD